MWEAIVGVFVAPVVFWCAMVFLLVCMIVASEQEAIFTGLCFLLIAGLLGLTKFDSVGTFITYITTNPWDIIAFLLLYMMIGAGWSIFKWYLYVKDYVKKHLTQGYSLESAKSYLNVSHNKGRIVTWIVLWVPSMIWFIIHDPIRRFGNLIYDTLQGVYQGIVDHMLKVSK